MTAEVGYSLLVIAIAVGLGVVTWLMLKADKKNSALFAASAGWMSAPGTITSATVHKEVSSYYNNSTNMQEESVTYEPRVQYSYSVAGQPYSGTRISFARLQFLSEKKAKAVLEKYVAGAATAVVYDPREPQSSVLDRATKPPRIGFRTVFLGIFTVAAAVLGIVMLILSLQR